MSLDDWELLEPERWKSRMFQAILWLEIVTECRPSDNATATELIELQDAVGLARQAVEALIHEAADNWGQPRKPSIN